MLRVSWDVLRDVQGARGASGCFGSVHGRPNVTNCTDPTLADVEVFVSRLTTPTVPLGAVGFRPRDRMAGRVVSSSLSSGFWALVSKQTTRTVNAADPSNPLKHPTHKCQRLPKSTLHAPFKSDTTCLHAPPNTPEPASPPEVCDLRQLGKKSGLGLTRACPMRTRYTTTTFGLCPWLNIDVTDRRVPRRRLRSGRGCSRVISIVISSGLLDCSRMFKVVSALSSDLQYWVAKISVIGTLSTPPSDRCLLP